MNRLLGICHADVDVHPEHELLTRDEAERVHEAPVAIVADDALLLPAREGMSARCSSPLGTGRYAGTGAWRTDRSWGRSPGLGCLRSRGPALRASCRRTAGCRE